MKELGASLLLIALLSIAKPVGAASVYMGTLAGDQPFTLNIDNATNGQGKTSVTVVYYLTGGRPATKFDVHFVPAAAREGFLQVIPRGTRLIAVEVAGPANSIVLVDARQGATAFAWDCVSGCTLTFDVQ